MRGEPFLAESEQLNDRLYLAIGYKRNAGSENPVTGKKQNLLITKRVVIVINKDSDLVEIRGSYMPMLEDIRDKFCQSIGEYKDSVKSQPDLNAEFQEEFNAFVERYYNLKVKLDDNKDDAIDTVSFNSREDEAGNRKDARESQKVSDELSESGNEITMGYVELTDGQKFQINRDSARISFPAAEREENIIGITNTVNEYSQKLASIPKEKSQDLKTYLNSTRTSGAGIVTTERLAQATELDPATVQTILSELCSSGIVDAKLKVRCPYCSTQHGIYQRKSNVPSELERCFDCDGEFKMDNVRNWEVIYEISEDPEEFFQNDFFHIEYYREEERDLPPSFFQREYKRFKQIENPKRRGREFDKLVGLLFQQIPGVEIRLKGTTKTGEVDVHISCLDVSHWMTKLVGNHTIIENKWTQDPIETSDVSVFRRKCEDISYNCRITFLLSMSGFTRSTRQKTGALDQIRGYNDPRMIDLWQKDFEEMVNDGTPENVLREEQL